MDADIELHQEGSAYEWTMETETQHGNAIKLRKWRQNGALHVSVHTDGFSTYFDLSPKNTDRLRELLK